ncbi:MAG TPA: HAD family hydrolase [Terriglobales bacterium]|nr:HAD family hydrolase [Terriglobales bacterium]
MKRAVFLDRDGVVNEAPVRDGKPYPPKDLASLRIPEDTAEALRRLKAEGFLLIVATNQPDVPRGKVTRDAVEAINQHLAANLDLDDVFTCYHDDAENCDCRKPKPSLFLQAARRYNVDLPSSYMIGDRWKDTDAGANAGCKTVLIDLGYQERDPDVPPNYRASSLLEAVDWILRNDAENA